MNKLFPFLLMTLPLQAQALQKPTLAMPSLALPVGGQVTAARMLVPAHIARGGISLPPGGLSLDHDDDGHAGGVLVRAPTPSPIRPLKEALQIPLEDSTQSVASGRLRRQLGRFFDRQAVESEELVLTH